ncbi:MAG: type II toxin-antitoxin system HicB family antitoxin [Bacteroidota bacterium]
MEYLVIYEKTSNGYSAYSPDLMGCTSAGASLKEIQENILETIELYLEVMREFGLPVPSNQ